MLFSVTERQGNAMAVIAEYTVKALPKNYETVETHCKMVQDYVLDEKGKPELDDNGRKIKKGPARMVREDKVVSKGGVMYTFPNGNSVRFASQHQLDLFKLSTQPRLIDTATGEECDERGVPKSLSEFVSGAGAPVGDVFLEDLPPVAE